MFARNLSSLARLTLLVFGLAAGAAASPVNGEFAEFVGIDAYETIEFGVELQGGEATIVQVVGGLPDLDVYIYDEFDNLVAFDAGPGSMVALVITPATTGRFTIQVRNVADMWDGFMISIY